MLGWQTLVFLLGQSGGSLSTLAFALPGATPTGRFGSNADNWSSVAVAVAAGFTFVAITALLARRREATVTTGWLAAALTSLLVSAILAGFAIAPNALWGPGSVLRSLSSYPTSVVWGLATGWIPALAFLRPRGEDRAGEPVAGIGGTWTGVLSGVAVLALVGAGLTVQGAHDVAQAEARAAANAPTTDENGIDLPDPNAVGDPVPTVAPETDPIPDDACTGENSMLLKTEPDAATGHRSLTIRLMNFSDAPCVVDGYPDLAFADQNGHVMSVTIEHGSSFMATDAGAQRVEVPAKGYAAATIGWDANSTHGTLVASTVYAAARAGADRGSWPIVLDIVPDTTVSVTAWRIASPAVE